MLPLAIPVALITLGATPINHPVNDLPLLNVYSHDYYTVKDDTRFSPGRNLRRAFVTDDGAFRRSIRVLDDYVKAERQLDQPAPAVAVSSDSTGAATAVSFTQAAPSGGLAACVAQLESGGNPQATNGSGHMGLYQFDQQTWNAAGGSGSPLSASPAEQTQRFTYWYSLHPDAWSQTAPRC